MFKFYIIFVYINEGKKMRTNLDIDDKLLNSAMSITHIKTKKGIVEYALKELIAQKRKSILDLKGKIKWEGNLDEMRKI
jgi:Arc/MetJ family transcription regulator